MPNSKKAICFRCGAYQSRNVRDHLVGRGEYKRCTGQLGGYYDKNGLRIACYVLGDEDEDGLPASEWKERYYPEDDYSELMEEDLFESDDVEAAVRSINDQLAALDEEKELYLAAWEEKRRALKRKAYEVSQGNAKRRRLDGGDEESELSEDYYYCVWLVSPCCALFDVSEHGNKLRKKY